MTTLSEFFRREYKPVPGLCFVLMPFRPALTKIYSEVIKPTVESCGMTCKRSDEIYSVNSIMSDVWSYIQKAEMIIAELTQRNPNVLYELGLCHTLWKKTIMIVQDIDDVPFDLRQFRCIVYENTQDGKQRLEMGLRHTIKAIRKELHEHEAFIVSYEEWEAATKGMFNEDVSKRISEMQNQINSLEMERLLLSNRFEEALETKNKNEDKIKILSNTIALKDAEIRRLELMIKNAQSAKFFPGMEDKTITDVSAEFSLTNILREDGQHYEDITEAVLKRYIDQMDIKVETKSSGYRSRPEVVDRNSRRIWNDIKIKYGMKAIPLLLDKLKSEKWIDRLKALKLITYNRDSEILQNLLPSVYSALQKETQKEIKNEWVDFLKTLRPQLSWKYLFVILKEDNDENLKAKIPDYLGRLTSISDVKVALIDALESENSSNLRSEIIKAIANFPGKDVFDLLVRQLEYDMDERVRSQIVTSLGNRTEPEVYDVIIKAIRDDFSYSGATRNTALNVLVGVFPSKAPEVIKDILREGDPLICKSVLGRLKYSQPELIKQCNVEIEQLRDIIPDRSILDLIDQITKKIENHAKGK